MTLSVPDRVACPACGAPVDVVRSPSIDAARDPELARALLDGSLFRFRCACGHEGDVAYDVLYHDPPRRLLVELVAGDVEAARAALAHAFDDTGVVGHHVRTTLTTRVVRTRDDLGEKVRLAAEGLDDRVWEVLRALLEREPGNLQGRALAFEGVDAGRLVVADRACPGAVFAFARAPYDDLARHLASAGALLAIEPWALVDRAWAAALLARLG